MHLRLLRHGLSKLELVVGIVVDALGGRMQTNSAMTATLQASTAPAGHGSVTSAGPSCLKPEACPFRLHTKPRMNLQNLRKNLNFRKSDFAFLG